MTYATAMMETIASKELTGDQTSRLIETICDEVQRMLREKNQHTYFTLNADTALILSALTRDQSASQHTVYDKVAFMRPYDEMDREEQRVAWLHEEIPAILKVLQARTVCLHPVCASRGECISPSPDTMLKWAHSPHAAALRNSILGHFHGLTSERVKRLLSDRPKTPPLR
jgi:aminoglycoside phosphotransferase